MKRIDVVVFPVRSTIANVRLGYDSQCPVSRVVIQAMVTGDVAATSGYCKSEVGPLG